MSSTPRLAIRIALTNCDQPALSRAMGRYRDEAEAAQVAQEELASLDAGTRAWWDEPQPGCDGTNCGHDHALLAESVRGWLEGV